MKNIEKTLLFSVWGLAALSLISLISTREMGMITVTAIATLFPLFLYFEAKGRLGTMRWLENLLILISFIASVLRLVVLKDSFLIVVADFLVSFILLKLLFKKTRNDLIQIIALSFFVLLSASTLALDFTFLFFFLLYIVAAAWALCHYSLSDQSEEGNSAIGPNELQKIYRHISNHSWLTLALALFFSAFIFVLFPRISLVVFQATILGPVRKAGFTDRMNLSGSGKIFEDTTVSMRVEIVPPEARRYWNGVLRGQTLSHFNGTEWSVGAKKDILTIEEYIKSRILNIRKLVKNQFQIIKSEEKGILKREFSMKLDDRSRLHQKIYLESIETNLLFGAPWIESVTARLPQVSISQDDSLIRPNNYSGRISYEVNSLIERAPDKILAEKSSEKAGFGWGKKNGEKGKNSANPLSAEISNNLQIPDIDFSRVKKLVGKIVSKRDSNYIKAKKIENYLRKNYRYTLGRNGASPSNPIQDFLFESREGHCEHFASAMAVMLRLEGIPARIVTGFIAGEWNPSGKYYVVRSKDAHSWVECYIGPPEGSAPLRYLWSEFDPSPLGRMADMGAATLWDRMKERFDYINFLWNANVLGYDMESQRKLAQNVELKSNRLSLAIDRMVREWRIRWSRMNRRRGWGKGGEKDGEPALNRLDAAEPGNGEDINRRKLYHFSIIISIIGAFILVVLWKSGGIKKLRNYFNELRGVPENSGLQFYHEMLKLLSKRGIKREESETPYEFIQKVLEGEKSRKMMDTGDIKGSLLFLTDLFYRMRFSCSGKCAKASKEELSQIEMSLQRLKAKVGGF